MAIKDWIDALIPPSGADEKAIARWRIIVAGALIFLIVAQFGTTMFAMGRIPYFSGYASIQQVENLNGILREFRITQLEEQIVRLRTRQCNALRARNQVAVEAVGDQLRTYLTAYRNLTTFQYPLPSCTELLVDTQP